jgi:hypothetical protein
MGQTPYAIDEVLAPFRAMLEGDSEPGYGYRAAKLLGSCLVRLMASRYPPDEAARRLDELYAMADPVLWFDRELPEFMALIPPAMQGVFSRCATEIKGDPGVHGPARQATRHQTRKRLNRKRAERRRKSKEGD